MSITTATKTHPALMSKIALVSAISLSLAAGSAALAAPAEAADSVAPAALEQTSTPTVSEYISADTPRFQGYKNP